MVRVVAARIEHCLLLRFRLLHGLVQLGAELVGQAKVQWPEVRKERRKHERLVVEENNIVL